VAAAATDVIATVGIVISVRGSVFRRGAIRWWLAATLVAGALLATAAPPATAAPRPLLTGVAGLDNYDPLAFQQARATGARLVHMPIAWVHVAPRMQPGSWQPEDPADPNYDWAKFDRAVTGAVGAGLTPVLLIDGAPLWAQRCRAPSVVKGEALEGRLCNPDPGMLAAFATAAARRYSGRFQGLPRVRFWQGMNEPNLSLFFNPQFRRGKSVSPRLYRKLINAFYAAVKAVDRSNLVLAAGLGPIAVPHLTIGPMRFARELLCMRGRHDPRPTRGNCDGGVHFDIFDVHPYTTGGPTHEGRIDDVQLGDLAKLKELLKAADMAGRIKGRFRHTPLWITEFSWDSNPPDPGGVAMRILSRWTAEALYQAWSAGVSRFFWFSLRDYPMRDLPFSETLQSGLYFRGATLAENQPKEVLYAFRFPFVAFSEEKGFSFWGRTSTSTGGKVVIQIWQRRKWRNASVARADRRGIFEGLVQATYGRNKHGSVRARYRGETAIPFSLRPVKDFYQPPFG